MAREPDFVARFWLAELFRTASSIRSRNSSLLTLSFGVFLLAASAASPAWAATAVGAIPGQFAVDATGASTYHIALQLPAGTGGMTPHLGLQYDSQTGVGLAGYGWTLSGLSAITRCASTIASDGHTEGITFTADDRFCLDGNKLRLTGGSYGADGATYRTEIERFSRITSYTSGGAGTVPLSGPQWFSVETPEGLTYEYGKTADAEVLNADSSAVRVWALDRITDKNGNFVRFDYAQSDGAYRPVEIDYTGHDSGLAPTHSVLFGYEPLPAGVDAVERYIGGTLVRQAQRLTSITIQYNGSALRKYTLAYETDGQSHRTSVASLTECAGASCLPATTFAYSPGSASWSGGTSSAPAGMDSADAHVLDVNGDGSDDILYAGQRGTWMLISGGPNGLGSPTDTTLNDSLYYPPTASVMHQISDGRDGLLVQETYMNKWAVLAPNADGAGLIVTTTPFTISDHPNLVPVDYDGDGRDDVMWTSGNQVYVALNTSGYPENAGESLSFGAPQVVATAGAGQTFSLAPAGAAADPNFTDTVTDFNGDGRGDRFVLLTTSGSPTTYAWDALASTAAGYQSIGALPVANPADIAYPVLIDVNGDGLADAALPESNGDGTTTWHVFLSTGTGFVDLDSGLADCGRSLALNDGSDRQNLFVDDCNGGWSEIHYAQGALAVSTDAVLPVPVGALTVRIGDFNGDDRQDVLWAADSGGSPAWFYAPHLPQNAGLPADRLTAITDGLGNNFAIDYASITATAIYSRGTGQSYPTAHVQTPFYVTSAYTANDGAGSSYTESYRYANARANLVGRGFLGFASVTASDSRNGVQVATTYRQDFPYIGLPSEVSTAQSNSTVISDTVNTYTDKTYGSKSGHSDRYFPYASDTKTSTNDVDGSLIKTADTAYVYDSYGDPTDITTTTTGGGQTFTAETTTSYSNSASSWCYGLPATVTVTRIGSASATRKTHYTNDTTHCRASAVTVGYGEPLALTTNYSYDSYGHRTQVTATGAGLSSRSTNASYGSSEDFPTSITNALGQVVQLGWDHGLGLRTNLTDANGLTTQWTYDGFGRKQSETRPDGSTITWTYEACGSDISCPANGAYAIEMALSGNGLNGGERTTVYDSYGRVVQTRRLMPGGKTAFVDIAYDALGRKAKQSAPHFSGDPVYWTTYSYDLLNRIVEVNAPVNQSESSGNITSYAYNGLVTTVTNPKNQVARIQYNALGEIVQKTNAYGTSVASTTTYTYTPFGQLATVTDADNNVTSISYNARGMKTAIDDPDMGHWTYAYDAAGELTSQTDAKGQTINQAYDALGRLTSRTAPQPDGSTGTSTWTYDSAPNGVGNLAKVVGADGFEKDYAYDTLSRLSSVTRVIDGTGYKISKVYDGLSRVADVMYPDVPVSLSDANAPVANAGADQTITLGQSAMLNGSATDADGDALTYHWTEDAGSPTVALSNANIPNPSFTPSQAGSYIFTLTVSDGLKYNSNHVTVTVEDAAPPATPAPPTFMPTTSTDGTYTVYWTKPAGTVTRYILTGGGYPSNPASTLLPVYDGPKTSYYVSNSPEDGIYHYNVQACSTENDDSCSSASDWAYIEVIRPPATPAAPTLSENPSYDGTYTISWSQPSGAHSDAQYTLQESTNGGGWTTRYTGTGFSWNANKTTDASYAYRVKACNISKDGTISECSPGYSASVTETVKRIPDEPSSISTSHPLADGAVISGETYTISWGASSSNVGYYVLQESQDDTSFSNPTTWNMGTARSKTFTAPGVTDYSVFRYRVKACTSYGCSDWRTGAATEVKSSSGGGGGGGGGCDPTCPQTVEPAPTDTAATPPVAPTTTPSSDGSGSGGDKSAAASVTVGSADSIAQTSAGKPMSPGPLSKRKMAGLKIAGSGRDRAYARFTYDAALANAGAQRAAGLPPGFVYAPPFYRALQTWHVATAAYTTDTTTLDHLTVQYTYDATSGDLIQISNERDPSQVYWQLNGSNAFGEMTQVTLGKNMITQRAFDAATGRLSTISSVASTPGGDVTVQQLSYAYDALGNLTSRSDTSRNLSESFSYDSLNRLTGSTITPQPPNTNNLTVTYDEIGNIHSKSDVGTYTYSSAHPHAVASISGTVNSTFSYDANGNQLTGNGKTYTWSPFNRPLTISGNGATSTFAYAPDHTRYQQATQSGTTTNYVGPWFRIVSDGTTTEYKHRLIANGQVIGVLVAYSDGSKRLRYLLHDALGSVTAMAEVGGSVAMRMSFTAFGERRDPSNWQPKASYPPPTTFTTDGYTGHEQLDDQGLINLNARIYDPVIGQIASADPTGGSGLSRYTYVADNPLAYTDPTGFGWLSDFVSDPIGTVTDTVSDALDDVAQGAGHIVDEVGSHWQEAAAIALAAWTGGASLTALGTSFAGYVGSGAAAGAVFAASDTTLRGGTPGQVVRAGVRGGIGGAIGGGFLYGANVVSAGWDAVGQTVAHGTAGGLTATAVGGDFKKGFALSAAAFLAYNGYKHFVNGEPPSWKSGHGAVVKNPRDAGAITPQTNNVGSATKPTAGAPVGSPVTHPCVTCEGGPISNVLNAYPPTNAWSSLHDVWGAEYQAANNSSYPVWFNALTVAPAMAVTYTALINTPIGAGIVAGSINSRIGRPQ